MGYGFSLIWSIVHFVFLKSHLIYASLLFSLTSWCCLLVCLLSWLVVNHLFFNLIWLQSSSLYKAVVFEFHDSQRKKFEILTLFFHTTQVNWIYYRVFNWNLLAGLICGLFMNVRIMQCFVSGLFIKFMVDWFFFNFHDFQKLDKNV